MLLVMEKVRHHCSQPVYRIVGERDRGSCGNMGCIKEFCFKCVEHHLSQRQNYKTEAQKHHRVRSRSTISIPECI